MQFLQKIQNFFYQHALKNKLKSLKQVNRDMVNIDDAKSIGILYNASSPKDIMVVSKFAEKLESQNKNVNTLGFLNAKTKQELGAHVFDKNSVTFSGVPNGDKIEKFNKVKYDILICAFKEECLPLEYIAATSPATFRVGAFSKHKTNFYELMINVDTKENLNFLLDQILHFTKVINKNA